MERQSHLVTITDQRFFCYPESVGMFSNTPKHSVTREKGALNNFNIHFVAAGKGYVEMEGAVYELEEGDAFLYFPLQEQRYYSSTSEPWDIRWVHFYGSSSLTDYMLGRGFQDHRIWTLRQPEGWKKAHLDLLTEAENHKMLNPTILSTLTYAVITEFVHQAEAHTKSRTGRSTDRITKLLPKIQKEAASPFILEHWAEEAGVSVHYFCKLFKKAMQMTPMDFITQCRIQMAKQALLEHTERTIGQIASETGYPSASYFNRRFLEHEGMTPTEYRRLFGK
ncbi:helix-turn-helix transcriptional regulator [Paenibacillus gallinarum]|uniref:Helix-turn-helix domain-containing protein n=1 Tax=Paenibacillus gallinarum TaxID=2762232 RepID=A0ABR8SZ67_9BACL|nr:AraC family transcriptional regulator [Paenibacillus gallinarum]MBD7968369.1 helix-turn-helix domain-containing protein [Paenibacillus gallinarum]